MPETVIGTGRRLDTGRWRRRACCEGPGRALGTPRVLEGRLPANEPDESNERLVDAASRLRARRGAEGIGAVRTRRLCRRSPGMLPKRVERARHRRRIDPAAESRWPAILYMARPM